VESGFVPQSETVTDLPELHISPDRRIATVNAMDAGAEAQLRILLDGIVQVVPEEEFRRAVTEAAAGDRPPLRAKLGVDPTKPDLHLGHAVQLRKLRQFQQLGHTVVLIIGGFTAQVGDPTGRSEQRPVLTPEDVARNAETYLAQAGRVLLPERLEIVDNADWLGTMHCAEVLEMTSRVTVAQILERDDFSRRLAENRPLSVMELMYPVLQGQDSVVIHADVEIGGTDQTLNMLVGRGLQSAAGQRPQAVMTLPLLIGLDGVKKMSKSFDNYVAFEDPPELMYGKLIDVPPAMLVQYLRLTTDLHPDETDRLATAICAGELPPRQAARRLAREVVALYYDDSTALRVDAQCYAEARS
jgi:tyrosyl-tRNA synthetase